MVQQVKNHQVTLVLKTLKGVNNDSKELEHSFPDFFVPAFKIVVDSGKFSKLLLYILWDDWPIFMISRSNQQLHQELEYTY